MIWHSATADDVLSELDTDREQGLSSEEAGKRLEAYGKNLAVNEEEISKSAAFIKQLQKPSVILLLCLLVIYVLRELVLGRNDFTLPIVAFIIICIKEALCIISEYKSRNMLSSLRNRIKVSATVIRDGKEMTVKGEKLVPGDIIKLCPGDYIPADARIIEASGLRCDESVIMEEKGVITVNKDADVVLEDLATLKERANMVYCGCHVMTGNALCVVVETGSNAEVRRLVIKNKVFLHKGIQDRIADRYDSFMKIFTSSAFIACVILTALGTFVASGPIGWGKFLEALIAAVCFYIAVVPGNFATRIACLLTLGIKRIEKDKASIINPQTVEKLAGITVICADKTGTLTQNKMKLSEVYDGDKIIDIESGNITKKCEVAMRFGVLSCEDGLNEDTDPTEMALISAASRYLNITKQDFDSEFPTITTIPLTPERKIKTTVNMIEGNVFAVVRGAPDIILERCVNADNETIRHAYEEMCNRGLRVLAISYKMLSDIPTNPTPELLEYDLEFLGLLGVADRERRSAPENVALCREAGISTVMFTGDHINTAATIAENIGILKDDEISVVGDQIDSLSDEELCSVANKIKVCARISPEQRIRMVEALHSCGETVLITADSAANYAPMAFADVGCAMGKTGTDVAKGNADIVLYSDSFSSIVKAVKNARGVFGNFLKYINYYVTFCTCLFVSLALSTLFLGKLLPSELILLGSVFALVFPIASIGFESADNSIMKQLPRTVGEQLFRFREVMYSIVAGVGIALVPSLVALINRESEGATAAYFVSLVITLVLYMYSTRSSEFFYKRIFQNRFLGYASIACIALAIIIAATPLNVLFGLAYAEVTEWLTAILLPFAVPLVFEVLKLFKIYINK